MKSITPNLAVGGEGFYHLHKPLKGASLAARAVWGPKEEHVATVKAGSFGQAELSYQRKVSYNPNPKLHPNPNPNPSPNANQEFANHLRIHFSVEDTGIGIMQEDMAKLFGLFSKIRDKVRVRARVRVRHRNLTLTLTL